MMMMARQPPADRSELSPAERETLWLMSHGYGNPDIGKYRWVSLNTVKVTVRNVLRVLGATDRTHATRIGFERGLLQRCTDNCRACEAKAAITLEKEE
jgi:DNA-binding NarL/FixJ family response regulator